MIETKYLPIDTLTLHPDNPRLIKDEAFKKLCDSIKANADYFETRPILCNSKMVIFAGNMRYRAAKEIGMTQVPVAIMDVTPEREKELMIRDNVQSGLWDPDLLSAHFEIDQLREWGVDMGTFGVFEEKDTVKDETTPDLKEETTTKVGEIFLLGNHRLMCGSSTEAGDVAKLMGGGVAELLVTSPPYSDMRDYNGEKDLNVGHLSTFITLFKPYAKYQAVNLGIQRKEHEVFQYWDEYIKTAKSAGYKLLSWNIWVQDGAGSIGKQTAFFPIEHEFIFIFGSEFKHINRTEERMTPIKQRRSSHREKDGSTKTHSVGRQEALKEMGTVFYSPSEKTEIRLKHPAIYPVELPLKFIQCLTSAGDSIIDPFLGSGSSLIAAEATGRKCYAMELDPRYVDVAVRRWEAYTGKQATKVAA